MFCAVVELPPEDQKLGDSSSPHEDHISAKLKSGDTQAAVPHKVGVGMSFFI